MKILLIEDDPTDRKLMHVVLKASGHAVHTRTAAEQAAEAIRADRPEIILLDLRLPGMDGLALIRRLKQDADTRDIPIVAVTAYPDRYLRAELVEAGCDAYILKPIDTRELPKKIEEVAEKKSHEGGAL